MDPEESYKKYQEFDFSKSTAWLNYFDNLFPTPPMKKLEKFKRKFYRREIDNEFDVSYKMDDGGATSY